MPHRIDLRNCIHLARLGEQPGDVIAAIRRSHGGPDSGPCDVTRHDRVVDSGSPPDIFPTVVRLLGANGFRRLWADFRRSRLDPAVPPRGFGSYLAANRRAVLRLGEDLPMLGDVARLDFAIYLARRLAEGPSVAAPSAALADDLIRSHPKLMLRLQPAWLYLALNWPVHRLVQDSRPQTLRKMIHDRQQDGAQHGERDRAPNLLRLSASPGGIAIDELNRSTFTFESALAAGQSFTIAEMAARQHDAAFDGGAALRRLIASGAVAELVLTPPETTETTA